MSDFLEVFPSFTFWNWYAIWLCCFVHLHLLRFRSFSTAMMHNHPGLWITDFAKFRISISEGSLWFCFHHLVWIFILAFSSCIDWGIAIESTWELPEVAGASCSIATASESLWPTSTACSTSSMVLHNWIQLWPWFGDSSSLERSVMFLAMTAADNLVDWPPHTVAVVPTWLL